MTQRPHVLVVGGGIAGLSLAAALDPERWRVTLVEGRPERAGAGAGLALWPGALRALDRLGVGEGLRRDSVAPTDGALRRPDGRALVHLPAGRSGLRLVARPALLEALERAVPEQVARRTEEVADPQALADRLGADLLVGADGVRSAVRRSAWPRAVERPTPWVAVRGTTATAPEVSGEWWGRGRLAGISPVPGGTYWFLAWRSALPGRDLDPAGALAEACEGYAGWDPRVTALLAAAEPEAVLAQRIHVAPPMCSLVAGRTVLLGDAAHAMTPNLGRGAAEAVLDALALADALHRHGPECGPAAYQRRRIVVGQALRVTSGAMMHLATARLPRRT